MKHCCIKYASDWLRERCEFSIIIRESIEAKLMKSQVNFLQSIES